VPPTALRAPPDLVAHLGFILAEEEALKQWLTGLKVPTRPGTEGTTDVEVWYRWPEGERQIKYPYITIDFLTAEPNYELFTSTFIQEPRGLYQPSFSPTLPPVPAGMTYNVREYLVMNLVWQVAVYSRSALHDRYLTSIFMTDVLPPRPFFIYSAADDLHHRTERVSFQAADTLETTESGTKRVFRKIYTISMLTEIPQNVFTDPEGYSSYQALRVLIPVVARPQFDTYFARILNGHSDPIGEFSQDQREREGEYFYIAHEGDTAPSA
jgi:hypothetical protein